MKGKGWLAKYKSKKRKTSMFFVLWAAFAVLSFVLLLAFSLTQRFVLQDTYRHEAVDALDKKGQRINRVLRETPPAEFGDNYDALIRYLSVRDGVQICILDGKGNVLMPIEENIDPSAPLWGEDFDFSQKIEEHKRRLAEKGATVENEKSVIYPTQGGFVYGAALPAYETSGEDTYLYVYQSVELVQAVEQELNVRMLWIALFVFILSFVVSSAISGVLIRPLDEISAKAKRLARGDFEVDFQGEDYFEEMDGLSASLNFAKDELSKTDRMQKELIANVSHDFKTPLTMIKAYASMIMEISGDIPEKRNKHAQVIVDEADRLASLVGDVLELSKMRSGLETLKSSEFDMSSYLHEILSRFDYLKDTKGYLFVLEVEENLWTRGDELKLGQVVYNLIGNAVNYTGEDKKVFVRLKKLNDTAFRFSVTDTGAGIKEEDLPTIWARYYRSSETHKRPVQGTGLGLSIVKTVLEKHRFVFGVDSERGKGSTFYVDFPLVSK